MSEHITHTAVYDDCARLALHSKAICQPFKLCLTRHHEIARLGAITRSGDRFTVQVLRTARESWANRAEGSLVEQKLAFLLGWRCHNAADRQFKPVYRKLDPSHYSGDRQLGPSDVSIYHDVVLFNEVYGGGREFPFVPAALDYQIESHPAATAISIVSAEQLLEAMWRRSLLELQSFLDKPDDHRAWLTRFLARYEPFEVDIDRYAQSYYKANLDRLRRFIVDANFYRHSDPLIALVRSIQCEVADQTIDLEDALEAAATQSEYAQALRRGYGYLEAASEFFEHKIDEEELRRRSDIGKPHVSAS